ncbi:MAG: hypothetical protein M1826_005315 [Phylliscum demangeonii]|nr:MAG: hypothetical protein M1826_005315 [Phylliscum demangeonii]
MKRTTKATRRAAPKVVSSLPAGARIRGLGYLKDRDDPVAEEDGDYPEWLWNCLSALPSSAKEHDDQEGSTASTLTRAAAKKAARKKLKAKAESGPAEVPLVEQSIDLPSNPAGDLAGAVEALNARAALTKAMRVERRKEIKESNYLKGMR